MASGWVSWYHWVRRWWAGAEYVAPTPEVVQPTGPTGAHVVTVGTRASAHDGKTDAANVTPGTRTKVS